MALPNVTLSLPSRKQKNLHVHLGCLVAPFYKCDVVAPEGAPVKVDTDGETVVLAAAGSSTTGVIGFLAQGVYDPSVLGELAGYEFLNETKAKIGSTIGVVTGTGYVLTKNYSGVVSKGDKLYPAASGKISASRTATDMSVGTAEQAGTDGDTLIRVRVNFQL
jgi:hypothetical protein